MFLASVLFFTFILVHLHPCLPAPLSTCTLIHLQSTLLYLSSFLRTYSIYNMRRKRGNATNVADLQEMATQPEREFDAALVEKLLIPASLKSYHYTVQLWSK
jgi:hypothetical protein